MDLTIKSQTNFQDCDWSRSGCLIVQLITLPKNKKEPLRLQERSYLWSPQETQLWI
jgi:hypothetical protein